MVKKRIVRKPPEKMPLYYKRIKEYFDIVMIHSPLAGETGQLTSSRILDEYRQQIDTYEPPVLTEEQRQDIFIELDRYIHSFCEQTGDMEKFNETRETAVLIYMRTAV